MIGGLVGLAVVIARLDLPPNLARVNMTILSGSERGDCRAIVGRLAAEARRNGGHIENVATRARWTTSSD